MSAYCCCCLFFFFFKQKTANEIRYGLVGSEMGIGDRPVAELSPRQRSLVEALVRGGLVDLDAPPRPPPLG